MDAPSVQNKAPSFYNFKRLYLLTECFNFHSLCSVFAKIFKNAPNGGRKSVSFRFSYLTGPHSQITYKSTTDINIRLLYKSVSVQFRSNR